MEVLRHFEERRDCFLFDVWVYRWGDNILRFELLKKVFTHSDHRWPVLDWVKEAE